MVRLEGEGRRTNQRPGVSDRASADDLHRGIALLFVDAAEMHARLARDNRRLAALFEELATRGHGSVSVADLPEHGTHLHAISSPEGVTPDGGG